MRDLLLGRDLHIAIGEVYTAGMGGTHIEGMEDHIQFSASSPIHFTVQCTASAVATSQSCCTNAFHLSKGAQQFCPGVSWAACSDGEMG